MHLRILQGSQLALIAKDGDRVVGFVTALSDEVVTAFIPLLEVLPEYRGQGIGHRLIEQVKRSLCHLYSIDLVCDAGLQPFYESLGFQTGTAMMLRNYDCLKPNTNYCQRREMYHP